MRVRERAWVVDGGSNGLYYVKTNGGAISYYCSYESAKRHADWINNDDSDGHYIDIPSAEEIDREIEERNRREAERNERREAEAKRAAEKREKEAKKIEENRKSKRSNDKYVYVISLIERGYTYTEYFKGDTNLLKMEGSFTTYEAKDAKVFQTKASAQKMVDTLTENYLVKKLYRNLKVVQKKRELFATKS